jgi:hypothetical protein
MSHSVFATNTHLTSHHKESGRNAFWARFWKNLRLELIAFFQGFMFIFNLIAVFLVGFCGFFFRLEILKIALGIILPFLFLFIGGKFVLLLPLYWFIVYKEFPEEFTFSIFLLALLATGYYIFY